jgi:hypothetical protein
MIIRMNETRHLSNALLKYRCASLFLPTVNRHSRLMTLIDNAPPLSILSTTSACCDFLTFLFGTMLKTIYSTRHATYNSEIYRSSEGLCTFFLGGGM